MIIDNMKVEALNEKCTVCGNEPTLVCDERHIVCLNDNCKHIAEVRTYLAVTQNISKKKAQKILNGYKKTREQMFPTTEDDKMSSTPINCLLDDMRFLKSLLKVIEPLNEDFFKLHEEMSGLPTEILKVVMAGKIQDVTPEMWLRAMSYFVKKYYKDVFGHPPVK